MHGLSMQRAAAQHPDSTPAPAGGSWCNTPQRFVALPCQYPPHLQRRARQLQRVLAVLDSHRAGLAPPVVQHSGEEEGAPKVVARREEGGQPRQLVGCGAQEAGRQGSGAGGVGGARVGNRAGGATPLPRAATADQLHSHGAACTQQAHPGRRRRRWC